VTASARNCAKGDLNDKEIEISVRDAGGAPMFEIPGMPGANMGMINMSDMLGKAFGGARTKKRRITVADSHDLLLAEESDKLLDDEEITQEAIR
jgi:ATP-dependent HslUV protease ATP-binding subunit HslU